MLNNNNVSLDDICNTNNTISEIQAAGFTTTELETVGYTLSDFAGISCNIALSTWVVQHQTSKEVFDQVLINMPLII